MTTLELIILGVLLLVAWLGKLAVLPAVLIAIAAIIVVRLIQNQNQNRGAV